MKFTQLFVKISHNKKNTVKDKSTHYASEVKNSNFIFSKKNHNKFD